MSAFAYHRLPMGWEVRPLKRIAALNPEVLPEDTDPEWTFSYVDIGNVTFEAGITGTELVRFADAPSRARRRVRNGDTIVSTVRTYLRAIAPVWNQPDDLIVSTGFAVIRARPPMDAGYLSWALRSNTFVESVVADSVGVSYPAIAPSVLGSLPVPAPPPAEQRAIADFLDRETAKIDALIATQERLIALLDEKRRLIFNNPCLDPASSAWPVLPLRRVLRRIEQGWSPVAEDRPVGDGEWSVLKLSAVKGGRFYPEERKVIPSAAITDPSLVVRDGDLLLTRANTPGLVGDACVVDAPPPRLIFSDLIYRLELSKERVDPRYVCAWLTSDVGRRQIEADARGSSQSMVKLSHGHIREWRLAVPPIDVQRRLVQEMISRQARLDSVVQNAEKVIASLRERRTALITAAVTGQIDVTRPTFTEAAE